MKKAQFFVAALLVVMLLTVVGCGTNTNWPDRSDNGYNNGTYNNTGGYNNGGYNYTTNNGITNTNNR